MANQPKVWEKFHYVQLSPLLTYTGISSAVQLLILAMCISCQKTGLLFKNDELAELLNTSSRNIQKAIEKLMTNDLVENQGHKHKRKLVVKYEQLCALITNNLAHYNEQSFVFGVNNCSYSYERLCALLYKEESKGKVNIKNNETDDIPQDFEESFVSFWNSFDPLPKINNMNSGRVKKLKIRLQEDVFMKNWKKIISKLAGSPFHTGQNDRRWKANVDWILMYINRMIPKNLMPTQS